MLNYSVAELRMNTTNGNMGVDLKRSISILGEDKRVSKQINS